MMESYWIYANTKDDKARFLLGEKGTYCLTCIGINPSTARPNDLDRTLSIVKRFASDLGYNSWLMLNVYPQRATDPNDIDMELNIQYHHENLQQIESVLKNGICDIWAAWGVNIYKRKYLLSCLEDICKIASKYNASWYTIGARSKEGHPHHPLYLPKGSTLVDFNIEEYVKNIIYYKNEY